MAGELEMIKKCILLMWDTITAFIWNDWHKLVFLPWVKPLLQPIRSSWSSVYTWLPWTIRRDRGIMITVT